jgi:hypothetical protein
LPLTPDNSLVSCRSHPANASSSRSIWMNGVQG